MIFVDSNVLIDIFEQDEKWFEWSFSALTEAMGSNSAVVNLIVIAECSPRFASANEVRKSFATLGVVISEIDDEIAYIAGRRFADYRRSSHDRLSLMSDFIIGAHALRIKSDLLTRDAKIYRNWFPEVTLITPGKEEK